MFWLSENRKFSPTQSKKAVNALLGYVYPARRASFVGLLCLAAFHIRRGRSLLILVGKVLSGTSDKRISKGKVPRFLYIFTGRLEPTSHKLFNTMKNKFILICALFCSMQMMATNLVVETRTGSGLTNDLAIIGKWMFVGQNLALLDKGGSILALEPLNNIRKIVFSPSQPDIPTDDNVVEMESTYLVYPNPTQEVLHIQGATDTTPLRIYTMEGKLLTSAEGHAIDVKSLTNGTYLLQIGTQVARFIKE